MRRHVTRPAPADEGTATEEEHQRNNNNNTKKTKDAGNQSFFFNTQMRRQVTRPNPTDEGSVTEKQHQRNNNNKEDERRKKSIVLRDTNKAGCDAPQSSRRTHGRNRGTGGDAGWREEMLVMGCLLPAYYLATLHCHYEPITAAEETLSLHTKEWCGRWRIGNGLWLINTPSSFLPLFLPS